jgi:hypothetical protein
MSFSETFNHASTGNDALGAEADRNGPAAEAIHLMSKLIDVGSTIFKKRHLEVGARPGTLVIADDAPPPKIRVISFDQDEVQESDIQNTQILAIRTADLAARWLISLSRTRIPATSRECVWLARRRLRSPRPQCRQIPRDLQVQALGRHVPT